MKLLFSTPYLYEKGGIQTLSNSVYESLKNTQSIRSYNYEPSLSYFWILILNFLPLYVSSIIYFILSERKVKLKQNTVDMDLVHFWHIECAIPNTDLNYIVSCYAEEILMDNIPEYKKKFYFEVFKNAKKIHTCSDFTKELLIKDFHLQESKISTIYSMIDYQKLSKIPQRKKPKLVIGTLSRLVSRKNIPNIIKALEILKNKYDIDFKFFLAGDGPDKSMILNQLSQTDLDYQYFGEISDTKKNNFFYPNIDIFVLPTLKDKNRMEGFGIVYIEANSFGIPVIASKVGGVIEAVDEYKSGLFVDPRNPIDIADKMHKLLLTKNKYLDSSKLWAKKFDSSIISKQFNQLYLVSL